MVQFRASAGERVWQVGGQASRVLVAFILMLMTALAWAMLTPTRAYAADDQIDSFIINYDMQPSGVLKVKETITWRFGSDSGRHGIQRDLVTREPDPDSDQDFVYGITTSTSPARTPMWQPTTAPRPPSPREVARRSCNIRIGDPDRTISAPTATYVSPTTSPVPCARSTAMTSSSGTARIWQPADQGPEDHDNCAWWRSGRQLLRRAAEKHHSLRDEEYTKGGQATFGQTNVAPGQSVSIGVKITPGSGGGQQAPPGAERLQTVPGRKGRCDRAGCGRTPGRRVGSPMVGVMWWRKNGRDQRYAGLAPGTVPLAGQERRIVPNDPDIPIPVAFYPPSIPVAEAGLLIDGQVDSRETAATIIDIAVRGALTVQSSGEDDFRVTWSIRTRLPLPTRWCC